SVSRVVLYGPPLAGKTTIVETFSRKKGLELRSIQVPSNHPTIDVPDHAGIVTETMLAATRCEVSTIPGGVFGDTPWISLIGNAQAVVVVLDCQADIADLDRVLQKLDSFPGTHALRCVVLSRADLAPTSVLEQKRSYLRGKLQSREVELPLFVTRLDQPETLVRPIDFLLDKLSSAETT
ncbi:MAG: hypothetical protein OEY14_17065, partial [Myxococcales bacterium]|nr:hypothetical protein [Myxococcales bacterium]